jgi:GntR family transcriptional repressor for pyruvate dehydrogenase complex
MEPIKRVRLSDRVIESIESMISKSGFAPGDRFLSENELVKRLEVSRSSIREAVRILEVRGRVVVRHGKGIFLAENPEEERDPFKGWIQDNKAPLFDHFEVRLIIEPKAARRAAEKADDDELESIRKAYDDFVLSAEKEDTAALIRCDAEFHRLIARSTKNRTLYLLMRTMTKSLPEGWITSLHIPGRVRKTLGEHLEILDAIQARNPERAEKMMARHLNNALEDIQASMVR